MAKKKALVTQHLENISREALEEHQDIIKNYIRGRKGIYALYRRGKIYYVGLAGNLRNRLKTHIHDRHAESWDRFSVYLTIGDEHMRELEAMILRIVKPTGNKVKGKFIKSEDLRKKVIRDFRARQSEEEARVWGGRKYQMKKKRKEKTVKNNTRSEKGSIPVLAHYVKKTMKILANYKGKKYIATVRSNGKIFFRGKYYDSPSSAAKSVIDKGQRNGWIFWKYERSPGYWVPLKNLRN